MRCARCRRDTPSVQQREEFCPAFLCDDCCEYEKTRQVFKLNSDLGESQRLYDKLMDLSKRIDELRREDEKQARQKSFLPSLEAFFENLYRLNFLGIVGDR